MRDIHAIGAQSRAEFARNPLVTEPGVERLVIGMQFPKLSRWCIWLM